MRVQVLTAAVALLFSGMVHANDGGIVGVTVQDLEVNLTQREGESERRTAIPMSSAETVEATFHGGNVRELMKWLPGVRSVVRGTGDHLRDLTIAAREGYVSISCSDAEVSIDDNGKETWTPHEPKCRVTIKAFETPEEGDDFTQYFGDWDDLNVRNQCVME